MKLLEIEEMSPNEIQQQLKKSSLELLELRMKLATRQLDNSSFIKKKRIDIARLLTIQTQKLQDKSKVNSNVQLTSEAGDKKDKQAKKIEVEDVKKKKKGLIKK